MSKDHFINVRLGEFFGFDAVFLASAEQIVQKRHVQLEHFDELDDSPVRNVELAVEIKRSRVAIATVLGDFSIVNVAGQLSSVLILFVFGLKCPDSDTILFIENQSLHANIRHDTCPIAVTLF